MSTSIAVVCYKYKVLANGESPLMLRITKDRKRTMKSLGLSINPDYWDFDREEPKGNCPNRNYLLQLILKVRTEYQKKLLEKTVNEEEFTSSTLINEQKEEIKAKTVEEYYLLLIKELREKGEIGNSYAYLNSYNSLKKFNKGRKLVFTFGFIDIQFLNRYENWLRAKGNKDTTISYQFRTLRAIFNKAILDKIVSSNKNPFTVFKVSKFNTKTQKRALPKDNIYKIIDADTSSGSKLRRFTQDLFTFSYLCGGISFVDIANLTSTNIVDGRLVYSRQKTHGGINLNLNVKALAIIDKYKDYGAVATYLFPILHSSRHVTPMQKSNRVHKICHQVNGELRKFAKELGIEADVTTYVARHSFATVLKKSGVNIGIISQALGHQDIKTTQIYLDSFDNEQIDEAMKNLL